MNIPWLKKLVNKIVAIVCLFFLFFGFLNNDIRIMVSASDETDTIINECEESESSGILTGTPLKFRGLDNGLKEAADYSDSNFFDVIKKGDIFFDAKGTGITNVANSYHVAIVEGTLYDVHYQQYYISVIEAYSGTNVSRGILCPERFEFPYSAMLRVKGATQEQIDSAVDFAISQIGKTYGLDGISHKNTSSESKRHWYCSELVWAAYYEQGIYLDVDDNDDGGSFVWPIEIRDSSETFVYMAYDKESFCYSRNIYEHRFSCDGEPPYDTKHIYNLDFEGNYYCIDCGYIFNNTCNIVFYSGDRYKEKSFYLSNEYVFFVELTVRETGYYILQTCGEMDTRINLLNQNVSSSTGGFQDNAFLRIQLIAGLQYQFYIDTNSIVENGYSKLIITRTSGVLKNGCSIPVSLNSFEMFSSAFSCVSSPNEGELSMVVVGVVTDGYYYIKALSDAVDTYLYCVDLASYLELEEDVDYNDDYDDDTDAQIYIELFSNKKYLIIFGSFNPQYSNGVDSITLRMR